MSSNRINQTDFANKLGIKRQAVNGAINSGKIVKHGSGRAAYIDLNCPLTKAYMKSPAAQRHTGKDTKPLPITMPPSPPEKEIEYAPPSPESIESAKAHHDKQEIERLNKLQATKKLELQNQKSRGELVERDTLELFVNSTYEIDNGLWKTLGLKASTGIAAVFDSDDAEKKREACEVIDKEVFKILKQVKREQNKFLKKLGAEKLPAKVRAA